LRIGLALLLAIALCACSSGGGLKHAAAPTQTPAPTAIPYEPDEEPTPRIPSGRVTTQIQATCSLSAVDAEISAYFRATVAGPNTQLRRVRLMLNNKMADDSGDIYVTSFEKNVTLHVSPGSNYSLVVSYVATNAVGPHVLSVVRCPQGPGPAA
jgi:hypothetical protein